MQSMEVISVNIWQILISLCNLLLLFLILKKFLFSPVKKMLQKRQNEIDGQYSEAAEAKQEADSNKAFWEEKLGNAETQAQEILSSAAAKADVRAQQIVSEAEGRADGIVRQAKAAAELEKKKAEAEIKKEIIDVSAVLTEKMLGREISDDDHKKLFASFLEGIGGSDDSN
ncbi:MAG: F0F1 ATP synthase subunit B [Clostridia bacterium]|nr:F0F1 ATP synthase subunit B [Clostridia bacterium]